MRASILTRPALAGVALFALVSCGGPKTAAIVPCRGVVTVAGKPAAGCMVVFHPPDGTTAKNVKPHATTGGDGTFTMGTYTATDGAPTGEFVVTLVWPEATPAADPDAEGKAPADRLAGKYSDPTTSPLRVTVPDGGGELKPIAAN